MQQSSVKNAKRRMVAFLFASEITSGPPLKYVRPKTANFNHSTHPYTQNYTLVLPTPPVQAFSQNIFLK